MLFICGGTFNRQVDCITLPAISMVLSSTAVCHKLLTVSQHIKTCDRPSDNKSLSLGPDSSLSLGPEKVNGIAVIDVHR